MQIPSFDFTAFIKQNLPFNKAENDAKIQTSSEKSTALNETNEENSQDKANLSTQTQQTSASQEKNDSESILEMLYEKLEKLQEQLNDLNAKINQSTDEELRLELLSQAQNIIAQMQKIMAQIIKVLNEMLKQQKMQQRLDAQA